MDVFNRRRKLERSGSSGKGADGTFQGQENRRPSLQAVSSSDFRGLKRGSSLQRGSGTSGASGSPRSVLGPEPTQARTYERQGSGAAYNEARSLYRSSTLARNSREPEQPGSARSRGTAAEDPEAARARRGRTSTSSSNTLGKKDKRPASKGQQPPPVVPIQAVWDNVYKWCGSWCGQAPRDVLSEDVDELHSKLDRLQSHCEKLAADNALIKEQNDRLRENMRLLHSNDMGRGSGGPPPPPNPRSSVVKPSPIDSKDDLSIPRGRGPVRKGDLVGNAMAWILGGPKPR